MCRAGHALQETLVLGFDFFVSENTQHLTKCWEGSTDPICLQNEYLFKYVQFQVFTYTECTYFEIINLRCFILFS